MKYYTFTYLILSLIIPLVSFSYDVENYEIKKLLLLNKNVNVNETAHLLIMNPKIVENNTSYVLYTGDDNTYYFDADSIKNMQVIIPIEHVYKKSGTFLVTLVIVRNNKIKNIFQESLIVKENVIKEYINIVYLIIIPIMTLIVSRFITKLQKRWSNKKQLEIEIDSTIDNMIKFIENNPSMPFNISEEWIINPEKTKYKYILQENKYKKRRDNIYEIYRIKNINSGPEKNDEIIKKLNQLYFKRQRY